MTDYDINKVSPRDWTIIERTDSEGWIHYHIENAQGHVITVIPSHFNPASEGKPGEYHRSKHVIHCVNHHDPLVEALENALDWSCGNSQHDAACICARCEDLKSARQALTAAKGEA